MSASSCVRSSCRRGPRAIIRASRDSFDSPSTFSRRDVRHRDPVDHRQAGGAGTRRSRVVLRDHHLGVLRRERLREQRARPRCAPASGRGSSSWSPFAARAAVSAKFSSLDVEAEPADAFEDLVVALGEEGERFGIELHGVSWYFVRIAVVAAATPSALAPRRCARVRSRRSPDRARRQGARAVRAAEHVRRAAGDASASGRDTRPARSRRGNAERARDLDDRRPGGSSHSPPNRPSGARRASTISPRGLEPQRARARARGSSLSFLRGATTGSSSCRARRVRRAAALRERADEAARRRSASTASRRAPSGPG